MDHNKKWLSIGFALVMGVAAFAYYAANAQPVVQNQLSGNECWNSGQGPGGPSAGFICTNVIRNSNAIVILTAVSGNITVGSSTNLTFQSGSSFGNFPSAGLNVIITAQPSVATITMPPSPVVDGAIVKLCNGTNSAFATNAVTVAANTNQTMVPTGASVTLTTLAAASCVEYQFALANTSWYKVQ